MILHTVTIDLTRNGFFFFFPDKCYYHAHSVNSWLRQLYSDADSGAKFWGLCFLREYSIIPGTCGRYMADFQYIPDNRSLCREKAVISSHSSCDLTWADKTCLARRLPHTFPSPSAPPLPPVCPHPFLQILPCLLTSSWLSWLATPSLEKLLSLILSIYG